MASSSPDRTISPRRPSRRCLANSARKADTCKKGCSSSRSRLSQRRGIIFFLSDEDPVCFSSFPSELEYCDQGWIGEVCVGGEGDSA
jgi:hypothetical protein